MKGVLAGIAVPLTIVVVGCASGGKVGAQEDAANPPPPIDATEPDAKQEVVVDAPPDAFVPVADAFVPPPPDACVSQTTQLLANPVFDLTPVGTGWQQTPIDPAFPLVTDQDGVPEHSAPFKAWLGGIVSSSTTTAATDILFQDVTIPPLTTSLVLTGQFDVRTAETDTVAFDTAQFAVTQTNGTPIVTILNLSNLTPKTGWTPINHTFTQNLSGQTIRIRMTSSNDFLDATSFYFDSLSLVAVHGCP